MNFFFVGYLLLSIQFNFSYAYSFIMKIIGLLFLVGGIWEMSDYKKEYKKLYKPIAICMSFSLITIICFILFQFIDNNFVLQIFQVIMGTLVTVLTLLIQNKIIKLLLKDDNLIDCPANIIELQRSWKKLMFFTALSVAFNIFNIIPIRIVMDISALLMAVSRIIMYIFAIVVIVKLVKVRNDYYRNI